MSAGAVPPMRSDGSFRRGPWRARSERRRPCGWPLHGSPGGLGRTRADSPQPLSWLAGGPGMALGEGKGARAIAPVQNLYNTTIEGKGAGATAPVQNLHNTTIEGKGAGATAPVENLHSTTIPAGVARPVELCMKSMRNTTGLGPGAGVDALCRFPGTLSAQSRGLGAGAGRPRAQATRDRRHPPTLPAPFTEPIAGHSREGAQPSAGRPRVDRPARSLGDKERLQRTKESAAYQPNTSVFLLILCFAGHAGSFATLPAVRESVAARRE
jgi:hypothetical protein